MFDVRGVCLNSTEDKQYFGIFIMIDHDNYRSAKTIYFPAVDSRSAFLYHVAEELKCTVEDITFAPHVNLGLVGIIK